MLAAWGRVWGTPCAIRHRTWVFATRRVNRERASWATGERTASGRSPGAASPCGDGTATHAGGQALAHRPPPRHSGSQKYQRRWARGPAARALSGHDVVASEEVSPRALAASRSRSAT